MDGNKSRMGVVNINQRHKLEREKFISTFCTNLPTREDLSSEFVILLYPPVYE